MIRNTYLCCSGHFVANHQKLRFIVDFKDPDVKRQLREALMSGKFDGKLIYDKKTYKWSLKDFNIYNTGLPGTIVPVTFDMLTDKGKELIINYLVSDFWLASFSVRGDDLFIPEKLLADKYNCICELQKAFNYHSDYLEEIFPFIPDKLKYNKYFMRDVLNIYDHCVNSEENRIKNTVIALKLDLSLTDHLSNDLFENPKFIKELVAAGLMYDCKY